MSKELLLNAKEIVIQYGDLTAVKNVSLQIHAGEIFGIIGPNGAGKSSLVECLVGLRKPMSGSADVCGLDPWDDRNKSELFSKVSIQLQSTNYPERSKVNELCEQFTSFYEHPQPWEDLLKSLDIDDKRNDFYHNLSGGQRQKLSIAISLLPNPKLLILDEITTGLDPKSRHELWDKIIALKKKGIAVVLVTHFMDEADALCDRLGLMINGELEVLNQPSDLIRKSNLKTVVSFRSDTAKKSMLEGIAGVESVLQKGDTFTLYASNPNMPQNWIAFMENNHISYTNMDIHKPSLEEAFLALTGYIPEVKSTNVNKSRKERKARK